jgi:Ca2+-binding RTX toxin-like protein
VRIVAAVIVVVLMFPMAAQAATIGDYGMTGNTVFYKAQWNEANHVRVWLTVDGHLIVHDSGVPLTARDTGCSQVGAHEVDCGAHSVLVADMFNMDDWLSFDVFEPGYEVWARGHAGNDWLRGGAGNDYLEAETAYGRGGDDTVNATYTLADGGAGNDRCYSGATTIVVACERPWAR